jgi:predicted O-methyltransferase YrrM
MARFPHWTPEYVVARTRLFCTEKLYPQNPWLTFEAIGLLDRLLLPTDVAVEFGAGRSTLWFAQRVAKLTSIEGNADWARTVGEKLQKAGVSNVELLFRPADLPEPDGDSADYVRELDRFADNSLDFILVDGHYRNHCALRSVAKVKPSGLLVIDNANWYLPSATHSPASRALNQPPRDALWQKFSDQTQGWRRIWTSNGVTDTLIMFKK